MKFGFNEMQTINQGNCHLRGAKFRREHFKSKKIGLITVFKNGVIGAVVEADIETTGIVDSGHLDAVQAILLRVRLRQQEIYVRNLRVVLVSLLAVFNRNHSVKQ